MLFFFFFFPELSLISLNSVSVLIHTLQLPKRRSKLHLTALWSILLYILSHLSSFGCLLHPVASANQEEEVNRSEVKTPAYILYISGILQLRTFISKIPDFTKKLKELFILGKMSQIALFDRVYML